MRPGRFGEHAVSPVIGVMLMVVVTIIIAAVVSAFAGGLAGEQKKVPVAQFDLRLYSSLTKEKEVGGLGSFNAGMKYDVYQKGQPLFLVIMKSGEPIPTSDLKLVTYYTASNGTVQKTEFSGQPSNALLFVVPNVGGGQSWGGSGSIIHPGEEYTTGQAGASGVDAVLGTGVSSLPVGSTLDVDVVHIPTNSVIYQQEVTVQ